MRLRGRHYVVLVILLVAVSLCYTTRIYHLVDEVVPDAYAQWWAGSMLVEYMKEHDLISKQQREDRQSISEDTTKGNS